MRGLAWLCVAGAIVCGGPAQAQLRIEKVPLHLGAVTDLTITTLGDTVALSAKVAVTLQNASGTIKALIPVINRSLACGPKGRSTGAEVTDITLGPSGAFMQRGPIEISATATARSCNGLLHTNVVVSVPVSVQAKNSVVVLAVGEPEVKLQGFFLASLENLLPSVRTAINRSVGKVAQSKIAELNQKLKAALNKVTAYGAVKRFNPKIDSIELATQGTDLTLALQLSGQISAKTVNAWLGS